MTAKNIWLAENVLEILTEQRYSRAGGAGGGWGCPEGAAARPAATGRLRVAGCPRGSVPMVQITPPESGLHIAACPARSLSPSHGEDSACPLLGRVA